jgi:hypothetical protein
MILQPAVGFGLQQASLAEMVPSEAYQECDWNFYRFLTPRSLII